MASSQEHGLDWLGRWAIMFFAVARLAGGHDVLSSITSALTYGRDVILSQALAFLAAVSALLAVGGFDSGPLFTGERGGKSFLPCQATLLDNHASIGIINTPLLSVFVMGVLIRFVPIMRALIAFLSLSRTHLSGASSVLMALLLRSQGVVFPKGDSTPSRSVSFNVVSLPRICLSYTPLSVLQVQRALIAALAQSMYAPHSYLVALNTFRQDSLRTHKNAVLSDATISHVTPVRYGSLSIAGMA